MTDVLRLAKSLNKVGYECRIIDCFQRRRLPLLVVKGQYRKRHVNFNWGKVRRASA